MVRPRADAKRRRARRTGRPGRCTSEIARRRRAARLTQAQAAAAAGWSQSTWADVERGRGASTVATLRTVARVLGCDVADLL